MLPDTHFKKIEDNDKSGKSTDLSDVQVDVTTTRTELSEATNVLTRTEGFAEESSVVTPEGQIHRGETGEGLNGSVSAATLPAVDGNDNTSIHSHPTETTSTTYFDALVPGPGDPNAFKGFRLNIIVGAFGRQNTDQNGKDIKRSQGAAFYSRDAKPLGTLTTRAINRVLKTLKE